MIGRTHIKQAKAWLRNRRYWAIALLLVGCLTSSCSLSQVSAEDRLYLNLSVDYLGEFQMPKQTFEATPVGGLSAIAYDPMTDQLYALSDDRGQGAASRFYTMRLELDSAEPTQPRMDQVTVERVTFLRDESGNLFEPGALDPEGFVLTPQGTAILSSEGAASEGIPPSIGEFDLTTGQQLRAFPMAERYRPQTVDDQPSGIQDNRGFEALTLSAAGSGVGRVEPFRVFAAVEEPLLQDIPPDPSGPDPSESDATVEDAAERPVPGRLVHYVVSDTQAMLIAEHLYPIEPKPFGAFNNGLVELLSIDQAGHFLSLERSFGIDGVGAKLFQLAIANATDTSQIDRLSDNLSTIQPIHKQLELDLRDLDIDLDNLEGMTLGPRLPDGSQSLILVSDDNFNDAQITQWLLFRLNFGNG
jgi:hypothetical protein